MGELFIPADGEFTPIPFNTVASLSDLTNYSPIVIQGVWGPDNADPTVVWSGTGGSLATKLFLGNQFHRVHYQKLQSGTSGDIDMLTTLNYIMLYAFRVDDGVAEHDKYNYVIWMQSETDDPTVANGNMSRGDWLDYNELYRSTGDIPSFVEEERDWDETPSEDPNDPEGIEPQGGEYADRMPFDSTYQQLLTELPNPELTMNMSYGGMLRTYVLPQADLNSISSALFNTNFWTQLKNKFSGLSNPLEMIVNCIQIPVAPPNVGTVSFRIGGVELEDDNGDPISVNNTTSRYVQLSFGAVTLKEVWGSAKDYSDCSISIYLPYVGVKELDPDVVVGSTMSLNATLDFWTGDILYLLHVSNATAQKKYFPAQCFAYRWSGNCSKTIPIGRVDTTNKMLGIIGTIAGLTAGAAALGVGLGGAASGAIGAAGLASQGMAGAATGGITAGLGTATAGMAVMGATVAKAMHSGFKPTVQTSSGISGAPGQMDLQYAYIMVKRGVPKYPNNWREQIGAPNYQTFSGVSMSGYTLFSEIHLTGMGDAAEEERAELERILCEEGVIL